MLDTNGITSSWSSLATGRKLLLFAFGFVATVSILIQLVEKPAMLWVNLPFIILPALAGIVLLIWMPASKNNGEKIQRTITVSLLVVATGLADDFIILLLLSPLFYIMGFLMTQFVDRENTKNISAN